MSSASKAWETARVVTNTVTAMARDHDDWKERTEKAEARVSELETAIGVMTPVIVRCFIQQCPPDANIDREAAFGVLKRLNEAMGISDGLVDAHEREQRPPTPSVGDDPPPPYCPHGIGERSCPDRETCAARWRRGERDDKVLKGGTNSVEERERSSVSSLPEGYSGAPAGDYDRRINPNTKVRLRTYPACAGVVDGWIGHSLVRVAWESGHRSEVFASELEVIPRVQASPAPRSSKVTRAEAIAWANAGPPVPDDGVLAGPIAQCGWCGETDPARITASASSPNGYWCQFRHNGPRMPAMLADPDPDDEPSSGGQVVTADDFDRNPKAAYDASARGPVTVLDSEGRPSMTVVQPRAPRPSDAKPVHTCPPRLEEPIGIAGAVPTGSLVPLFYSGCDACILDKREAEARVGKRPNEARAETRTPSGMGHAVRALLQAVANGTMPVETAWISVMREIDPSPSAHRADRVTAAAVGEEWWFVFDNENDREPLAHALRSYAEAEVVAMKAGGTFPNARVEGPFVKSPRADNAMSSLEILARANAVAAVYAAKGSDIVHLRDEIIRLVEGAHRGGPPLVTLNLEDLTADNPLHETIDRLRRSLGLPEGKVTANGVVNTAVKRLVLTPAPHLDYARVVDWAGMTAEDVAAALAARPVVLESWKKWDHSRGWSRNEVRPIAQDGASRRISIQPNDANGKWHISGFGEYRTYIDAPTLEDAMRLADENARAKGWKLLDSDPCTAKAEGERSPERDEIADFLSRRGLHGEANAVRWWRGLGAYDIAGQRTDSAKAVDRG